MSSLHAIENSPLRKWQWLPNGNQPTSQPVYLWWVYCSNDVIYTLWSGGEFIGTNNKRGPILHGFFFSPNELFCVCDGVCCVRNNLKPNNKYSLMYWNGVDCVIPCIALEQNTMDVLKNEKVNRLNLKEKSRKYCWIWFFRVLSFRDLVLSLQSADSFFQHDTPTLPLEGFDCDSYKIVQFCIVNGGDTCAYWEGLWVCMFVVRVTDWMWLTTTRLQCMGERITLHSMRVQCEKHTHTSTRYYERKIRNMRIEWQAAMQFSSPSFIHTTRSAVALSVSVYSCRCFAHQPLSFSFSMAICFPFYLLRCWSSSAAAPASLQLCNCCT